MRDGQRLRVSIFAQDGLQRAISAHAGAFDGEVAADGIALADHMPGYRLGSSHARDAAAVAYAEMVERTSSAWRTPARVEADREEAVVAARDAVMSADDHQRVRDQAYASYVARITGAWRGAA